MKIGLPKGLYYYKYQPFLEEFLKNLPVEVVVSPDTNRKILNEGVKKCVDDACLPLKIFHGHAMYLRDKCDLMIVTRIMEMEKNVFVCPKFCGLPEMLVNSIENMPPVTTVPMNVSDEKQMLKWCSFVGRFAGAKQRQIDLAFRLGMEMQKNTPAGIDDRSMPYRVALVGHTYNVYDRFSNMELVQKLKKLNTGVVTEEAVSEENKKEIYKSLLIDPFWFNVKDILGTGIYLAHRGEIDGVIFLSSFQCGIDSVVVDLMRDLIGSFPVLVLKLDEHTGEAGLNTRLEAFMDMIKRRRQYGYHVPSHGEYLFGCKNQF